MVFLAVIAVIIIGLLLVSIFSKDLRGKLLDKIDDLFSTGLKKAPVAIDLVVDPLKENIARLKGV